MYGKTPPLESAEFFHMFTTSFSFLLLRQSDGFRKKEFDKFFDVRGHASASI